MPATKKAPIRVGVLGQGRSGLDIHCRYFKTAPRKYQIVAISDLLRDRRQRAATEFTCDTYADYRDLLARDDLDSSLRRRVVDTTDELERRLAVVRAYREA